MKSKSKQSSNKTKTSPFINYPNFQVNVKEQEDLSIDWSADNLHTLPTPHVPLLEHVLLPCVPLPQEGSSGSNVSYASSTYPENYIPVVMPPPNHTSPPSTAATFLATRLMAVLQPSGYSVFHGGDTPIQLSLP